MNWMSIVSTGDSITVYALWPGRTYAYNKTLLAKCGMTTHRGQSFASWWCLGHTRPRKPDSLMGGRLSSRSTGYEAHGIHHPPYSEHKKGKIERDKQRRSSTKKHTKGSTCNDAPCVNGKLIPNGTSSSPTGNVDLLPKWQTYSYPIENIVMSGGGSKGYSFIGSLKVGKRAYFQSWLP